MIIGVLGPYGSRAMVPVFLTLAAVYVAMGVILNRFVKGESPELFLEIPPYRRPSMRMVLKKTWMRVRWFLSEAVPFLLLGVLLVNLLYSLGVIERLGYTFAPFMEGWLGLPGEAVAVLLVGFLRKDLAVGMLLPLGLTGAQLMVAITVLSLYFPCVATFAVIWKELGIRNTIISTAIMVVTALAVGGAMHFILMR
jgi:ferrous iron transport protein B